MQVGRGVTSLAVAGALLVGSACTTTPSGDSAANDTSATTVSTRPPRPAGPAAGLSEITAPGKPFIGAATTVDLAAAGYVEQEFVAEGVATSYTPTSPLTGDGMWALAPDGRAPYRSRVLVRRSAEATDSSGTVVVEWLNVSGGLDADVEWTSLHEEITRQGHTWVGVSAQRIGVEGGPVLVKTPTASDVTGKGLKAIDPARYATLAHPGDGFSFDIYTQVARAIRARGPMTDGLEPTRLLAAGESQSAIALTTYYNGVQPLTDAFDGFFVHSRSAVALGLVGPGESADLAGAISSDPVRFRTDLDAPVMNLQAEADVNGVLRSVAARQPDTDRFRLWEVAGTSHADAHILGPTAELIDCGVPINDGPLHIVAKAALRSLDRWVTTGDAPPTAPLLELTTDQPPANVRDGDGIALGGVRTPPVDVPVDVLSGQPGPDPTLLCILLGSTVPLPVDRLAELYPSSAEYQQRYDAATNGSIESGFVLDDDRAALTGYSQANRVNG